MTMPLIQRGFTCVIAKNTMIDKASKK
jgi:hypothetical protein